MPGIIDPLTIREVEVLRLLAAGRSNQAIADQFVVTLDTVKKHVGHVLGKLGAANRTEAVAPGAGAGPDPIVPPTGSSGTAPPATSSAVNSGTTSPTAAHSTPDSPQTAPPFLRAWLSPAGRGADAPSARTCRPASRQDLCRATLVGTKACRDLGVVLNGPLQSAPCGQDS